MSISIKISQVFIFTALAAATQTVFAQTPPPVPVPNTETAPKQTTVLMPTEQGQGNAMVNQPVQPTTFKYQRPPNSNLGKQVSTLPKVVYPSNDQITQDVLNGLSGMQLTPEQIDQLKIINLEKERSRAYPYVSPAKPMTRTLMVNLDSGKQPPALRLSQGTQTSVVFSDINGQPWFIESVSMNRSAFSDGRAGGTNETKPTNLLTIEPLSPTPYGNVTVTLKGLSTPVIFVLTASQKEVDMRVDAKIPGYNPDAQISTMVSQFPSSDSDMPYFLDGVPPTGAKRLTIRGIADSEAWLLGDNLYFKTRADVQHPAYLAAARSTTGMSVYRFSGKPNSVTLLSGGRAITAFIE